MRQCSSFHFSRSFFSLGFARKQDYIFMINIICVFSSFFSPSLPIIHIRELNFAVMKMKEGGSFCEFSRKKTFFFLLFLVLKCVAKSFSHTHTQDWIGGEISSFIRKSTSFANSPNVICSLFYRDFHLLFKFDRTFNSSRFHSSLSQHKTGNSLFSLSSWWNECK